MRRIFMIAFLPLLLLATATAHAHALLDHASPLVGSTVRTAPRTLSLWFTQNVESAFSTIEVRGSGGVRFELGKAQVDRSERNVLRVGLKPLPPGIYQVHWRVLSVDTHTTEGNFSFRVGEKE